MSDEEIDPRSRSGDDEGNAEPAAAEASKKRKRGPSKKLEDGPLGPLAAVPGRPGAFTLWSYVGPVRGLFVFDAHNKAWCKVCGGGGRDGGGLATSHGDANLLTHLQSQAHAQEAALQRLAGPAAPRRPAGLAGACQHSSSRATAMTRTMATLLRPSSRPAPRASTNPA